MKKRFLGFASCTVVALLIVSNWLSAVSVDKRLVAGNNSFGINLFHKIADGKVDQNVFISPFSISSALAMTCNGAAGTTEAAMRDTLGLKGMTVDQINSGNLALARSFKRASSKIELNSANSLWAREGYPIRREFVGRAEKYYDAKVSGLKGAPGTINSWVKQHTKGKITKIVDKVDPLSVLFLVNATYFKGDWARKFEKARTTDGAFHISSTKTKNVPMMWQSGDHEYFKTDSFEALRLPYGDKSVSMYIFLPDAKSDLKSFYKGLTPKNWDSWMGKFRNKKVEIAVPKFKAEWGGNLNEPLKALGMGDAFMGGRHNFSKMTSVADVYVYAVMHKSFVQVDEEGTTAAAATSVEMRMKGKPMAPPIMIVNRPFFCAIRHDATGEILFMGTVANPQ
ncbi:MAG TPA: serpin family protein [Armatimonadota bacterium]|jgi:serpin B